LAPVAVAQAAEDGTRTRRTTAVLMAVELAGISIIMKIQEVGPELPGLGLGLEGQMQAAVVVARRDTVGGPVGLG